MSDLLQHPIDERTRIQARLTIDTGYAIVEMALEDESIAVDDLMKEGARLIQQYWYGILMSAEG